TGSSTSAGLRNAKQLLPNCGATSASAASPSRRTTVSTPFRFRRSTEYRLVMYTLPATELHFSVFFRYLVLVPPVHFLQRLFDGPDRVHRFGVKHLAVLHHVLDTRCVADVVQWALVQDEQVGKLACFQRSDVLLQADCLGAIDCRTAQGLHCGHTAGLQI